MTTWPDEGGDSELDLMDPTAAPGPEAGGSSDDRGPAPADDRPAARQESPDDADGPDEEGALTDPTRAVHVWLDADKRLRQVRISNRWPARLKKKPLAETVLETIRGGQAIARLPRHEHVSIDQPSATLNDAALARLIEKSVELDAEAAELSRRDDVAPTRFVGEDTTGTSGNRRVTVRIDLHGRTVAVDIEQEWATQATAGDLSDAVRQAHAAAYEAWTPPSVEPGDWDRLNDQRADVVAEIMAMFRRGL